MLGRESFALFAVCVVLVASQVQNSNHTFDDGFPLLFIHFHKSGGSNMCRLFSSTREHVIKGTNCNCNALILNRLSRDMTNDQYKAALRSQFRISDVCGIEHVSKWPGAAVFHGFVDRFPGRVITLLRDPWRRFKSNYERDMFNCKNKKCGKQLSMEEYYALPVPNRYTGSLYGAVHRPNYHVRFLASLGGTSKAAGQEHLEIAKGIMLKFHEVYFLEQDEEERNVRLSQLLGVANASLATTTNNANNPNYAIRGHRRTSENAFQERYIAENKLDYELYYWAAEHFNVSLTSYSSQ